MLVINLSVVALTHYMSIASLVCCVTFPICTALIARGSAHYTLCIITAVIASVLSAFCHRRNIVRLIHHEENKLDFGKISRLSQRKNKK